MDAVKTIKGSLSKDNNVLSKACMSIKGYYVEFIATDSNIMTIVKTIPDMQELKNYDKDAKIVFDLNILEKLLKDTKGNNVTINTSLDDMPNCFEFDNGVFKTYLIKENMNYPKYEGVVGYSENFKDIGREKPEDEYKIGLSKKLLTNILKSYDNKHDNTLEFTFNKNSNLRAVYIRPYGINNDRKVSLIMPIALR